MNLSKIALEEKDYQKALEIWESSVTATYDFLKEKDRLEFKSKIPKYFKRVEVYLWFENDEPIDISSTNEQNLDMLFIDPKYFTKGYGTKILQYHIQENKVQYVDVYKDNHNAVNFYIKNGFKKYKESQTDEHGKDYPILHLKL